MAKQKGFKIDVAPDEVMYTAISTSKDGYKSARMVLKKGDKEYMSVSYEWEASGVPSFVMDLMGFMKSHASLTDEAAEKYGEELKKIVERNKW